MASSSLGFIGGGRITAIMLEALERGGLPVSGTVVSDSDPGALARLAARFPIVATTDNCAAAAQPLVVMALHPPAARACLPTLAGALRPDATLVSLAPVLDLACLRGLLGGFSRLARVIPNAPSLIGRGFNPTTFAPDLPEPERERLRGLLDLLGEHPEVPEHELEAWAILTAMGPTYMWFQWQALRELGVRFGLTPAALDAGLGAMIHGAADMLFFGRLGFTAVADTIPVKPLAAHEAAILAAYDDVLPTLYRRLTSR